MAEERKKAELKISGMTCATCATTIEKSLLSQHGVADAQVNLGTETATVEYAPTKVQLIDLEKAVTDAGYSVINERATLKNLMGLQPKTATVLRDSEGKEIPIADVQIDDKVVVKPGEILYYLKS